MGHFLLESSGLKVVSDCLFPCLRGATFSHDAWDLQHLHLLEPTGVWPSFDMSIPAKPVTAHQVGYRCDIELA